VSPPKGICVPHLATDIVYAVREVQANQNVYKSMPDSELIALLGFRAWECKLLWQRVTYVMCVDWWHARGKQHVGIGDDLKHSAVL